MVRTAPTTRIRKRWSTFARPFSDSRRQDFVSQMIRGLVIGGHVHLTAIARATPEPDVTLHAAEKKLSRHLSSEHWNASLLVDQLLRRSVALVIDDTIIAADTTDLNKEYARQSVTIEVGLPEVSEQPFLLVIGWRYPKSDQPWVRLVSPAALRAGRTGAWYVRAYGRRWGVPRMRRGGSSSNLSWRGFWCDRGWRFVGCCG